MTVITRKTERLEFQVVAFPLNRAASQAQSHVCSRALHESNAGTGDSQWPLKTGQCRNRAVHLRPHSTCRWPGLALARWPQLCSPSRGAPSRSVRSTTRRTAQHPRNPGRPTSKVEGPLATALGCFRSRLHSFCDPPRGVAEDRWLTSNNMPLGNPGFSAHRRRPHHARVQ